MRIDFVRENLEKFLRSKESDYVSLICTTYPGSKPSEYMGVKDKTLAYKIDKMLALREYHRHKEDVMNANEVVSANIRALQLTWAGKGADKKIAEPKFSEHFAIRDFDKTLEEPKNNTKDEIPFWADDARLEAEMNTPLSGEAWDEMYTSMKGGVILYK